MKEILKSFWNKWNIFIQLTSLFLVCIIILKTTEIFLFKNNNFIFTGEIILRSFSFSLIFSCLISVCIFPFYFAFSFIYKKISVCLTAIIFSIFFIIELALTIYTKQSGMLMGIEIFLRPINETMQTIGAFMKIGIVALITTLIILFFVIVSLIIIKKKWNKTVIACISIIVLLFSCSIYFTKIMIRPKLQNNIILKNFIINKTYSLIYSVVYYKNIDTKIIDYNEEIIDNFLKDHPEWEVPDKYFPLERKNIPQNKIGVFFKKSENKPNIVLIIVESLGKEFVDSDDEDGISFTPFFDSLANTGLYWENCLSTYPRSALAVPATTASVPLGNKGFQFGIMPQFNSLLGILKKNNYTLNAFQADNFNFDFDLIKNYLYKNKIDYLAPFFDESEKESDKKLICAWGYNDSVMFVKSLDYLNKLNTKHALFNLFITVSMHEPLDPNNLYYKHAITQSQKIYNKLSSKQKESLPYDKNYLASVVFTDNALRNFFNLYSKRYDFENTIFVITGDHASGKNIKNVIDYFRVPLVIWSPLINENRKFSSVVSHNDITPTIVALLQKNFNFKCPEYVSWMGQELDTLSFFCSNQKTCFLSINRIIPWIIYNDLFLSDDGLIYKLEKNFELAIIKNDSLLYLMKNKLNTYKYINSYVYNNDKLINHTIFTKTKKEIITHAFLPNPISMFFKKDKYINYNIFSHNFDNTQSDYRNIEIDICFKVFIDNYIFLETSPSIYIFIESEKSKRMFSVNDYYEKFIIEEKEIKKWLNVKFSKTISIKEIKKPEILISFIAQFENYSMKIKDIEIVIKGEK